MKSDSPRTTTGGHQESRAGNPNSGRSYPVPGPEHHETCFDLVERMRARHSIGRSMRLAVAPEDAASLLLVMTEIAALACHLHDRALPDGPPLLHQLRELGGAA